MPKKTESVYELVNEVLGTIPEPYGEKIIEDVFLAIESRATWRTRYNQLVDELSKDVVNNWIGRYAKQVTGLKTVLQVTAIRSKIVGSYSKLRS